MRSGTQRIAVLVVIGCFAAGLVQAQAGKPDPARSLSLVEALQATLEHNIAIGLSREDVNSAAGARRQAAGAFDLAFSSGLSHSRTYSPFSDLQQLDAALAGVSADAELSNFTSYQAGVSRLFRNGVQVSQVFTLQRAVATVDNPSGQNTSHVGLAITLPLLRGAGAAVVGAQETAAHSRPSAIRRNSIRGLWVFIS